MLVLLSSFGVGKRYEKDKRATFYQWTNSNFSCNAQSKIQILYGVYSIKSLGGH